MQIDFYNKKVLITGATRGIGKELALAYSSLGAQVVITGTSQERTKDLAEDIFYEQLHIDLDTNWRQDIEKIFQIYDGFDICINNAGINKIATIDTIESENIDRVLLVNLNAPISIASIAAKYMKKKQSGFIINIASIFGVVSKEGRDIYTASKSGLIGVTKTMAIDLAKDTILVNAISPGFVDTELTRRVLGKEGMKQMQAKIPMQKLAKPKDIVSSVLFLTSKYNTYITGQNIIIDGGFTLE